MIIRQTKKLSPLLIIISLWAGINACAPKNNNKEIKSSQTMNKTLVVYFSATGTTKAAATQLAKEKMQICLKLFLHNLTPMPTLTGKTNNRVPLWK